MKTTQKQENVMDTAITQKRTENPKRQWLHPVSESHSLVKS